MWLHNYIKLANIIEQNIRRGTGELSFALENELNRALVERKNTALKRGSEISTKLLGPMTVMLIVASGYSNGTGINVNKYVKK